jgi:fimbrial chaperone protein
MRSSIEHCFEMFLKIRAAISWIALVVLAASSTANAGSLSVSPLRLNLSKAAGLGSIIVENQGSEEALVQTETFAWNQVGGEQKLEPTEDVIAMPPIFRLAPGAQQSVRVGLTRGFTEKHERTFRVMVTEVPIKVMPGTVAVAVRHSLPIFVAPSVAVPSNLLVKAAGLNGVEIANAGGTHLRIQRWRVRDSSGAVFADGSGPGYLLAGANHSLPLGRNRGVGELVFEADVDERTMKIVVGP